MKKPDNTKKISAKKGGDKGKDSDELRKPAKLKPLKEKEKKGWKHKLDDEEDDFTVEDDIKFDNSLDDDDDDDDRAFYDDDF